MNRIREERVSGSFRWLGLSSGTDGMTPPPPLISRGGFRSPFRGRGRGIVQVGYFFVDFSIFTYRLFWWLVFRGCDVFGRGVVIDRVEPKENDPLEL